MDRNRKDQGHELAHQEERERTVESPAPLSPVAALQRRVGNARLLQLRALQRAAIQRQDFFDPAREDAAARRAAREQAALEQRAAEIQIPSGGTPLPAPVQMRAEKHLGVAMDDVRVVHGASHVTDPLQAHAFTTEDAGVPKVVLGGGVDLNSQDGQFTLMHELTHVAQQKQGKSSGLDGLGGDGALREGLENHADDCARQMCAEPGHKHSRENGDG